MVLSYATRILALGAVFASVCLAAAAASTGVTEPYASPTENVRADPGLLALADIGIDDETKRFLQLQQQLEEEGQKLKEQSPKAQKPVEGTKDAGETDEDFHRRVELWRQRMTAWEAKVKLLGERWTVHRAHGSALLRRLDAELKGSSAKGSSRERLLLLRGRVLAALKVVFDP